VTVTIHHGDSRAILPALDRRFTLAYLDPPFFTQRAHEMPDGAVAFDDRWDSLDQFVGYVASLALNGWRLLLPGGSLVVHVDPKTSHYVKVALDSACCRENFASEIIWRYRRWPTKTANFQRVHDVLLRYVRPEAEPTWNQLYEPLSPKTVDQWGQKKQRAVMGDGSEHPAERLKSSTADEESPGAPLGDVWDIGIIGPNSKERTDYPTQKPEALLERLVLALTKPGDWALDPTCGSGTMLAVCATNGRHAVGVDASEVAIRIAEQRLAGFLKLVPTDRWIDQEAK